MYFKNRVQLFQRAELLLEFGHPRGFLVIFQRPLAGKNLQIGDILLGVLVDEIIGQRPGLGIGVDGLLHVHKAVVAADQRLERVDRPLRQILLKLGQPRAIDHADARPTFASSRGRAFRSTWRCPR